MARSFYDLSVASEEQTVSLYDGYTADIRFDPIYKRWYYNLYLLGEPVAMGIAMPADSVPLLGYVHEHIALLDSSDSKAEYEPYLEMGNRLSLVEVSE